MTLRPAPPNSGITFRRIDLDVPVDIPASALKVSQTTLGTTLENQGAKHLLISRTSLWIREGGPKMYSLGSIDSNLLTDS